MAAPTPNFIKSFHGGLQRLYDADKGDVTFVCGPLKKNVHSLLLGVRSTVFDTMLNSQFQEGLSKRIELKEQDPYLAARMLQHLYGFDYYGHKMSMGDEEESSHVSELHTHAKMYALGDEYDIMDLKEEALWKFEKAIESKRGHTDELTCVLEVIFTVYATTPDSDRCLRDIVVAFGAKNMEWIKDLPEFNSAATRVPIYLIEVLPRFISKIENMRTCQNCTHDMKFYCPKCGHYQKYVAP